MSRPTIYHSGVGFAIGTGARVEGPAVSGEKTGEVSARHSSERLSVALPLDPQPPLERYDPRDHLVGKSDILAAWAVAIGVLFLLMVVA